MIEIEQRHPNPAGIKRIAVLTSGGDAPGMNAAIRAVVRDEPGVHHVNTVLTQHLGPSDVLVNVSLDMDDALSAGAIEAMVSRVEARLKARSPDVTRVFIEVQARATPAPDALGAAPASVVASAVGWVACPAEVPSVWAGAAAAEAAETILVSDCRPRFASSMPAKVPAVATARTSVMTRAAISPL